MKAFLAKIGAFFRREWLLKLISLLLAVFIWFLICEYVDPVTDTPVSNIPITVNYEGSMPQSLGLGIMTTVDDVVTVRVRGSRDTIALMNPAKITATLDMSNVTNSGEYDLPVKIDVGNQNIILVSQSIETVHVRFDLNKKAEIKVNVTVKGGAPDGYILEEPTMLNSYISVNGPAAIVDQIVSAEILLQQESFPETNSFNCAYTFVDANGEEVPKTFLTVNVESLEVTVSVVKEKNVPLSATIVNSSGGKDSAFTTVKIEPAAITITGSAEVVDNINAIDLGVIDVAERSDDFETPIKVVLPNGVKNVNNVENAKVSVAFNNVVSRSFTVKNLKIENLPRGTSASISEKQVTVTVRGLSDDLNRLSENDITLIIDAKNQVLPTGSTRFSAYASFPEDLNVGAVGKYQLTVVVS